MIASCPAQAARGANYLALRITASPGSTVDESEPPPLPSAITCSELFGAPPASWFALQFPRAPGGSYDFGAATTAVDVGTTPGVIPHFRDEKYYARDFVKPHAATRASPAHAGRFVSGLIASVTGHLAAWNLLDWADARDGDMNSSDAPDLACVADSVAGRSSMIQGPFPSHLLNGGVAADLTRMFEDAGFCTSGPSGVHPIDFGNAGEGVGGGGGAGAWSAAASHARAEAARRAGSSRAAESPIPAPAILPGFAGCISLTLLLVARRRRRAACRRSVPA